LLSVSCIFRAPLSWMEYQAAGAGGYNVAVSTLTRMGWLVVARLT
jgi:hypothetical protein